METTMGITLILTIILISVSTTFTTGCFEDDDDEIIIGVWKDSSAVKYSLWFQMVFWTFKEDGTLFIGDFGPYQWEIREENLVISYTDGGEYMRYRYSFHDNDNMLILYDDGRPVSELHRQGEQREDDNTCTVACVVLFLLILVIVIISIVMSIHIQKKKLKKEKEQDPPSQQAPPPQYPPSQH